MKEMVSEQTLFCLQQTVVCFPTCQNTLGVLISQVLVLQTFYFLSVFQTLVYSPSILMAIIFELGCSTYSENHSVKTLLYSATTSRFLELVHSTVTAPD